MFGAEVGLRYTVEGLGSIRLSLRRRVGLIFTTFRDLDCLDLKIGQDMSQ